MKLPDGPKTPPTWQLIQWITDPLSLLDECARVHGDTFTLHLSKSVAFVFFSNPQAIQEIFTADTKQFDAGRANRILRPLVGDNSILMVDGDRHQRQRRLLMPPFHGERMRTYLTMNWHCANSDP